MTEQQEKTENAFKNCCQGMPFGEMMGKILESKMEGTPLHCAEMISRMAGFCCGSPKNEENPPEDQKDSKKI